MTEVAENQKPQGQTISGDADVDDRLRYLCDKSRQLREHSNWLKVRSQELLRRSQSCLNLKRAA